MNANPCQGLYFGQIVANPDRCDAYLICILGGGVTVNCDSGKIFHPTEKVCVAGNRETCEFDSDTTTTTTEPPTTTTTTTTAPPPPSTEEICRGVFFGARAYGDSLSFYVGCIREFGTVMQCFDHEYFHPVTNACLVRWTETTTEGIATPDPPTIPTTEAPTTTTRIIQTTPPAILEGVCEGKFSEYVNHPQWCALYIYCYDEMEHVRQCPQFHIFDNTTST